MFLLCWAFVNNTLVFRTVLNNLCGVFAAILQCGRIIKHKDSFIAALCYECKCILNPFCASVSLGRAALPAVFSSPQSSEALGSVLCIKELTQWK